MRVNRKQLYTESIGCNIASDSASSKSSQSQIYANHVVILPHYPDSLVNYTFAPLTAHSDSESLTKVNFGRLTPSSGNKEYPLQWKLRVDPSSGNMVVIR